MSLFSETLKEYVEKSHISVRRLSLELNMDRTLFHKYLSGIRIPKTFGEVQKISRSMMLLPAQQKRLKEAYAKSIYGEKSYQSFEKIRQILEGIYDLRVFRNFRENQMEASLEWIPFQEEGSSFYGTLQVEDALIRLFYRAVSESGGERVKVRMLIQPDLESITKTILRLSGCFDLEFEHIICLDCSREDNDNIGLLFPVLAFEFGDTPYQSYFYYDNMDHRLNSIHLLPNMILIGNYVFLCGRRAEEALIIRQSAEVEFFHRKYGQIKRDTEKLGVANHDAVTLEESLSFCSKEDQIDLKIGYFPCLTAGITETMFRQHFKLDLDLKEKALSFIRQNQEYLTQKHMFFNYFSEQGLRRFLEEGILPEYPADVLKPFSAKERILIVNRLIQLLKMGAFSFYMADETVFHMEDAITIYAGKQGSVHFWLKTGAFGQTVTVRESGIGETIHNFVDFAQKTGLFYDCSQTVERIERLVLEYSG